jgi:NADPH:quinone reductase-like Zn-dependent oxidoreductase
MRRRNTVLLTIGGLLLAGAGALALVLSHDAACPAPATAGAAEAAPASMRAVRVHCYGEPAAAMTIEHVPIPVPAEDELLVRVHAAGVNPLDWHYLHGKPYVMRLSAGIGRPASSAAGVDFAGTVEAVGAAVRDYRPGDAVFGMRNGAFGEYLVVREAGSVARIPDGIGFEEAAAVPIAAVTALQAVRDAGRVGPGSRVLVNGASGGVGTFAVQIASALGAEVTGVSSARNTALVASLGADHTLDYAVANFTQGGARYDVIIDNVGNHGLAAMRAALVPDGILVMVTGPKTGAWLGPLGRMLAGMVTGPFVSQEQVTLFAQGNREDMAVLRDMLAAGTLRAVVDRRFTLDQVPDAIGWLAQGRTRGKNVVVVAAPAQARQGPIADGR